MTARPIDSPRALAPSAQALRMRPNAIRALTPLIARPDVVSFAGGVPSPLTFPREEIARIASDLVLERGDMVLQYATTRGNTELSAAVVERMKRRGADWVERPNVILTSGSQQGLDLVARALVDVGDVVFVELPSYIGGLASLYAAGAEIVGVPLGDEGIDVDALEAAVLRVRAEGKRARAVYTIPTFQNPSGVTATEQTRARLLAVAETYDLLVVEDDPYSEVYFSEDARPPAPVCALAGASARVVYLGSFSKILCPGLRAAWVAADAGVTARLELAKEAADLCSSTLDHAIVARAVDEGLVDARLPTIREFYAVRARAMLDALGESAPAGFSWTRPTGGLFVWVNLPPEVDGRERLEPAIAAGVAYVPGAPFFVDGGGANTLRLAFSKEEPEAIRAGVATLVGVLTDRSRPAADTSEGGIR